MRNIDQIRKLKEENAALRMECERLKENETALERELGRYRKKVEDDRKLLERLRGAEKAAIELSGVVDAILARTAMKYGEPAMDPDNEAMQLGWRLVLPAVEVAAVLGKYQVKSRKDEITGEMIIGVSEREAESDG